jgi:type I restriction enzyme, R subunit
LREATFSDFLRHALGLAKLRSREDQIAAAFDVWVTAHPRLNATQLMFVRTVRQALLSHARITTVAQLEEPPFSRIGEPRRLFTSDELNDILGLTTKLTA